LQRLTLLAILSLHAFTALQAQEKLRWGSDAEGGAPYIFRDPAHADKYLGYEVELAEALGQKLGYQMSFVQNEFKELTNGLKRGDYRFALNGIEATADRAAQFRLSRPYYVYQQQLVVRVDDQRFANFDDCLKKNATVGTMEETAADRMLTDKKASKKLYNGPTDAYRDLELGRIDAVLLDLPMAATYALPNPKLRFAGDPLAKGYYVIVMRKDDEEFARKVDQALQELWNDGTLRRIYEKWRLWNPDQLELEKPQAIAGDAMKAYQMLGEAGYLRLLWEGAKVTIRIAVLSMLLAVVIGLPIALMRLYGPWPLQFLSICYVEFFRGIPVLFLLYVLYYGVPEVGNLVVTLFGEGYRNYGPEFVAILAFGLNYAAYEAEVYRAGLSAVPVGQWEAAAALGMPKPLTFRRIVLPQALRSILPPMTNDFVALFKDTSLVSAISLVELSKQFQILSKPANQYFEIGLATATLYLLMSVPLGWLARHLEKKWLKGSH
jgi:polar amino acid transport system substrate-binding protein